MFWVFPGNAYLSLISRGTDEMQRDRGEEGGMWGLNGVPHLTDLRHDITGTFLFQVLQVFSHLKQNVHGYYV